MDYESFHVECEDGNLSIKDSYESYKILEDGEIVEDSINEICERLSYNKTCGAWSLFETIQENYGKFDTELIAVNGEKYYVNKDEVVGLSGTRLCWYDDIKYPKPDTPVAKAVNLDNILVMNTIKN